MYFLCVRESTKETVFVGHTPKTICYALEEVGC